MPRQARLDAPGLLHHVMARGLNREIIFKTRDDYRDFLGRIAPSLEKSPNQILACSLLTPSPIAGAGAPGHGAWRKAEIKTGNGVRPRSPWWSGSALRIASEWENGCVS